jgi:hypothetical protein
VGARATNDQDSSRAAIPIAYAVFATAGALYVGLSGKPQGRVINAAAGGLAGAGVLTAGILVYGVIDAMRSNNT